MKVLITSVLLLSLVPAAAQVRPPGYDPRTANERPARDGCVNVPGVPHNSADCSTIPLQDYSKVMNTASKDLGGRVTGATENHERNIRIMSGKASN